MCGLEVELESGEIRVCVCVLHADLCLHAPHS